MFLWSGIFQSKWILSQLNTCIRKKKKPLLSLPSGLEERCQMLFWKKPRSKVVLSLKNKEERRYNLGEQMKGGGSCEFSQHFPLLGSSWRPVKGHIWGVPRPPSQLGTCGPCPWYKENKYGHRYVKGKRCLMSYFSSKFWRSMTSPSPWYLGPDCPYQSSANLTIMADILSTGALEISP